MRSRFHGILVAAFAIVLFALPVLAHHSFEAEFDADKPVVVKGTLNKIDWINPHIYFYMDAKDESGKPTNWTVETFPTGFIHRAGLTRDMFKIGDELTVLLYHAKDGTKNFGWLEELTFANGKKIVFGGASGGENGKPARPKTN